MLAPSWRALVNDGSAACRARQWPALRIISLLLARDLQPRPRVLARQVALLIDEGEPDLAAHMWWHVLTSLSTSSRDGGRVMS
jgi:hypothetical protein